ncbi:LexA family protein [Petrachloros mirabilis]
MELPPRQKEALDAIVNYIAWYNFPPTVRDLAAIMKISVHAADQHLRALARKGVIKRSPGIARGIIIPQKNSNTR